MSNGHVTALGRRSARLCTSVLLGGALLFIAPWRPSFVPPSGAKDSLQVLNALAWVPGSSGSVLAGASVAEDAFSLLPECGESVVAMQTAGGRRKRLGVGGPVCMLTGRKKQKVFTRTFSEKKNKRYVRPNANWHKLWWPREKKWVRLFVTANAIKKVDVYGLEKMCKWAGLDLYAWTLPHWMPGSRQPLALKIGYSSDSKNDLKYWPDYNKYLNKGKPLAAIRGEPIRPLTPKGKWKDLFMKGEVSHKRLSVDFNRKEKASTARAAGKRKKLDITEDA